MRWNSHWHGLILEGGFDEEGTFVYLPISDINKITELFRPKVPAGRRCPLGYRRCAQGSVDTRRCLRPLRGGGGIGVLRWAKGM